MYRFSSGFCFNADLNGKGNILRTCLNKNIVFDMENIRSFLVIVMKYKDIYPEELLEKFGKYKDKVGDIELSDAQESVDVLRHI